MKRWHLLVGAPVLLLLVIQLVPNELPPTVPTNPGDLIQSGIVDENVATLLKRSCYSCHSNETEYPWYSYVAPSSWLVAKDVREAREEVNFSLWREYDMMDQLGKLDDIYLEVDEGRMPMGIYTLMHPSAKLDEAQRQTIIEWAEATMDVIAEEDEGEVE
ncbi:heme-binding domain-containing protein [Algoriphagus terrigena]|uniref:heme-binding domain-containing protein n=1 Tax=Algoriphagus terrigena TaxID=344884 RepID=UPI000416B893|nr:heme-binding domain-containing protein [Algoriphagus terrigena]